MQTVAIVAPSRPQARPPSTLYPARKPTKVLTMISGPGVDSPTARPATMSSAVSQPNRSTAALATKGSTA